VTAPVIEIRDLEFGWTPDRPLLRIERLDVAARERVFVHGPSGSGKSSLLGLLAGVTVPQRGSLNVLGTAVSRLAAGARDAFRADHVGIIFQMFNLVPYLSVLENVTLPCRFSARRRREVDARGGPRREGSRLLEHLDLTGEARSARAVMRLSVGQQQRVAAARALIGRPAIVLADEPTSALDADRRDAFLQLLFRECEAEGATLLFVSHDRRLEPSFDRTLAIEDYSAGPPANEA
jgi:putative ABC transport system ATP-binding protein